MEKLRCKICGAELNTKPHFTYITCRNCGMEQTLPRLKSEPEVVIYNAAHRDRILTNDFILSREKMDNLWRFNAKEADLGYDMMLAQYGVVYYQLPDKTSYPILAKYVDTPIPLYEPYQRALQLGNDKQIAIWKKQAKEIEDIRKKCAPYKDYYKDEKVDVLIDWAYDTDEMAELAEEIIKELNKAGYYTFARNRIFKYKPDVDVSNRQHFMMQRYEAAKIAKCCLCLNVNELFRGYGFFCLYSAEHKDDAKFIELTSLEPSPYFKESVLFGDADWKKQLVEAVRKVIGPPGSAQASGASADSDDDDDDADMTAALEEMRKLRETVRDALKSLGEAEASKSVFISYSSRETAEARKVKDLLEKEGISCWMAPESIPAGSDYGNEIANAIRRADFVVVMLSANSQSSKWVSKEVDFALKYDGTVIPFQLDDSELTPAFDFRLTDVQRIYASGRFYEAFSELLKRIG